MLKMDNNFYGAIITLNEEIQYVNRNCTKEEYKDLDRRGRFLQRTLRSLTPEMIEIIKKLQRK